MVNIIFNALANNIPSGIYNIPGTEEFTVKDLVAMLFKLKEKPMPDQIFGKTERIDVRMKVLKLDGEKLRKNIDYKPATKIAHIYNKYTFNN